MEDRKKAGPLIPKVVVVDDSRAVLLHLEKNLSAMGLEVATYNHTFGADTFILEQKPDVVLMDVEMPALDGASLCQFLKSNKATAGIKIYLFSSLSDVELQQKVAQCRADGFLRKGDPLPALAARLRGLFASGRS